MASRTQITWLEEWVSPGICLLARTAVQGRASLGTVEPKVTGKNGIWACVHENEMALIDAPFPFEDADAVLQLVDGFIAQHRVRLKYIVATRLESGNTGGLMSMLNRYKASTFLFPQAWQVHWQNLSLDRQQFGIQQSLSKQWDNPKHQPYEDCLETQLAGERMFLIDAPFHSLTDQLVVFRGVALVPNWHLPTTMEEPLPIAGVPQEALSDTLTRLTEFDTRHRYAIHASVSTQGTSPVRHDFQRQTLISYLRMAKQVS